MLDKEQIKLIKEILERFDTDPIIAMVTWMAMDPEDFHKFVDVISKKIQADWELDRYFDENE